ncbi:MAG: UDP-glucose/GDP-mannose dehydrogenase family protein [Candidatus Sungbacteria bacterium]|uniref:UDP-glucose/GDP-mannose dehydrogenase family protein n=1 Tax=Candidatus Sungiibacteriota bacterium TaxID=2750080 RepID=A0A9D6LT69_9BACT|nr:UDP-glucose/GDP-mannose dehydrogenase family protein [Candidatus Sungbacteria bacterium]
MRQQKLAVGVVGVGMVGTPLARWFLERQGYVRRENLFLSDLKPEKEMPDDVNQADVIFISVPTPSLGDRSCDISRVAHAIQSISGEKIIVIKSTVPPGTTEHFQNLYPRHKFLFNPENLTERNAWEDFVRPDAQIVGFTEHAKDAAMPVLALLPKAPFMSPWGIQTYRRTSITATEAEIIKYARNVFFARKVVFANLLAKFSKAMGADYENVRSGMSADFRVGDSHLDVHHNAYLGFGGYCLPKDVDAFIAELKKKNLTKEAAVVLADREYNRKLLLSQGLTLEDASVHDGEWIKRKIAQTASLPSGA